MNETNPADETMLVETDPPRKQYRLYVPKGGAKLRAEYNLVGTFPSRRDALKRAEVFVGSALIEEVVTETKHTVQWPGL